MCVSPISPVVEIKNKRLYLQKYDYPSEFRKILRPFRYNCNVLPCGKCIECMKDRSNDVAVRSYLAAQALGSMHFVTLTYAPNSIPLAARLCLLDKSNGEVVKEFKYKFVSENSSIIEDARKLIDKHYHSGKFVKPIYIRVDLTDSNYPSDWDGYVPYVEVTPSLDRRDIKLWFKRTKIAFERLYNEKFPVFKYIVVGEYGPKTNRPHYHLALFGLKDKHVNFMLSDWQSKYGFSKVDSVSVINKDGSNGYLLAAKYIGKYISKGVFECESVKNGDAEKPRLQTSIDLYDISKGLIKYYRCYDIFGQYDINSLRVCGSNTVLSLPDLEKLSKEVKNRSTFSIGGFNYKLPKSFIKKLWYVKDESSQSYQPSAVRIILQSFIQTDILQDFISQYQESNPKACREDILSAVSSFKASEKHCQSFAKKNAEEIYKQYLAKSLF